MTRDRAKELLPVIKGFAEGRDVEYFSEMKNKWLSCDEDPDWYDDESYRLKELPVYAPFSYQDIDNLRGKWVKNNFDVEHMTTKIHPNSSRPIYNGEWYSFEELFHRFTFLDGTPCGKLKES